MNIDEGKKGLILAIFAGMIFGTAAIFVRLIDGVTPVGIAAFRLAIGFGFVCVLVVCSGKTSELKASLKHYRLLVPLGVVSSIHFLFFVIAVKRTFVANAVVLANTAPIFTLMLAPVALKERVAWADVFGVAIAFSGASMIVGLDKVSLQPGYFVGDMFALGCALSYAAYVVMARRLRRLYSSHVIMFWFFGLGAAFLFLAGLVQWEPLVHEPSRSSLLYLFLLGAVPTGIGHFCYNMSLKFIKAATAATIVLLESVSAAVYAFLLLKEIPPAMGLVGIGLALIGITICAASHLADASRELRGAAVTDGRESYM